MELAALLHRYYSCRSSDSNQQLATTWLAAIAIAVAEVV